MSQENVEVMRAYAEAYNAGGDAFADFLVDYMAEDVEIVPDASRFPEAKPFRGREAAYRSPSARAPASDWSQTKRKWASQNRRMRR